MKTDKCVADQKGSGEGEQTHQSPLPEGLLRLTADSALQLRLALQCLGCCFQGVESAQASKILLITPV